MKHIFGLFALSIFAILGITAACSSLSDRSSSAATKRIGPDPGATDHNQIVNPTDAKTVINAVAERYGNLQYYRSRGINSHSSNFDGTEKIETDVPFQIEYSRGKKASIDWSQSGRAKSLKIERSRSWLEVGGKVEQEYKLPRDGVSVATLADGGWSLFIIHVFVFRDEFELSDKFFAGLIEPKVIGEREVDGRTCYLLSGTYDHVEAKQTFWIDKVDAFIRRIEREILVRKVHEGKEYINRTLTTETYSDIEIR